MAERSVADPDSYYSRKQNFSIKMQAVCDHQLKIRHICVGYPGSVHDSRIFTNSSLFLHPSAFFDGEEWLAADSTYKLSTTIITSFRSNSTETESVKARFNKLHSKYRVRIELCFGVLKERFGILKELRLRLINEESSTYACQWVTVCCILHNFIIVNSGNLLDFGYNVDPEEGEGARVLIKNVAENSVGELKRKIICGFMFESQ